MKPFIYAFIFLIFCCCSTSKEAINQSKTEELYLIKKISTKNSWYIIYAQKQDSMVKIISKKREKPNNKCRKIIVGRYYHFFLKSVNENAPIINGVKLQPMNYLDVECYSYDKESVICIEPERGIYDLYFTDNLQGLWYCN